MLNTKYIQLYTFKYLNSYKVSGILKIPFWDNNLLSMASVQDLTSELLVIC